MEEEPKKSLTKKILLIFISILIVSIIASTIYIYKTYDKGELKETISGIINTITGNDPGEIPPEEYIEETNNENSGGSGGSGSSGGGGSGGGTIAPNGCTRFSISYSITDKNKESTCTAYSGSTCIERTVACLATITNRDNNLSGHFSMDVFFKNQEEVILKSTKSNLNIGPNEFVTLQDEVTVTGEDASQEIMCYFSTVEEPYKEIC